MGTGYTRNDTSGNIANGKVIDATDLDGEFDAIVTAFSTSGHTHDGTAAEGGKVTKLLGTSLTLGDGTSGTDITVTFDGETSDGVLIWMEDEDYFQFNDDILMNTNEKLQFRDTGIYISSNADGDLDIVSDGTAVDSINIESAGGITLDAGTAASGVIFEDDGTEMLRIYNSSSDVYIESKVSDKDILIRGNDGGSAVTAVTFDMSAAGLATFGGGITSTAVANTLGATSFNDANITNVGNIALDSITADGSTITITGNTTFADGAYNFNIASHDGSNGLQLGGTLVTATAAELNLLDGVTATTSELNIIDGVTATTSELNTMDGITSTVTELNLLDGSAKSNTSITLADTDAFIVIDNNTTIQMPASNVKTYVATFSHSVGTSNTRFGHDSGWANLEAGANYNVAIGSNASGNLTTGDNNTAVGFEANGYAVGGSNNTAIGYRALKGSSSSNNLVSNATAIGEGCLDAVNSTDADGSTAVGNNALGALTSGQQCTAIGYWAGRLCTTGDYNTFIGYKAGDNTSTGSKNFIAGPEAGRYLTTGDLNTYIGWNAGLGSSSTANTASYNTFLGSEAGKANTTGGYNTIIGSLAGRSLTTATDNTFIGYDAGQGVTTGNNNIAIGSGAFFGGSGGSTYKTGSTNIVIGYGATMRDCTSASSNIAIGGDAGQNVTTGGTNTLVGHQCAQNLTTGSNNMVLGNAAEVSAADVSNEITLGNGSVDAFRCNDQSIASLSDARDKTDVIDSSYGLEFINSIRPVQFKWDRRNLIEGDLTTSKNGKTRLGFIAQELQESMPNNENDILDLVYESNPERLEAKYGNLIPVLTKAIQDLSEQNKKLEERIIELEKK